MDASGEGLDTLLSWRLAVAGRLMRATADTQPGFDGPGAQGGALLMRLLDHDGETQATLARAQRIEPPTLCRMVDRLERDGYVERRAHPDDRRAVGVHLTEAGRRAAQDGWAAVDGLEDGFFAVLDDDERRTLGTLLHRLLQAHGRA